MTANTWPLRPLARCAQFRSGGTPSKSKSEFWEGDIPWVSSGEMTEPRIYDTSLRITPEAAEAGSRLVPANTVLVVVRGMSLAKEFRVAITRREVAFNQDLKALLCEPDVIPEFLFYALLSRRDHIRDLATEASHGTKKLETDVLGSVNIAVPPPAVQRSVVSILSAYDDLIENNRRRMTLLEDSARLLYLEWFVHLRYPGYEHTSIANGVPQGWERLPLEDALLLQRGFDLPTQDRHDGTVPIYGSTGILGYHDKAKATAPGIVTGRSGTLGEVQYVAEDYWPLNTSLWVKEFKRVTPLFSLFLLRQMNLKQYNGGVSVPTLDRKSVHRVEILIPTPLILRSFDEFVADIFDQIKNINIQNQRLRAARDLLLPRLMNGELAA